MVLTGANSGIGLAATRELARRGATVVMGCRDAKRGAEARDSVLADQAGADLHVVVVDTSSMASVDGFAQEVRARWPVLQAVINNAAVFDITQARAIDTAEGFETVWATNYLGPRRLTERLTPSLDAASPGRVVNIASKGLLAHPRLRIDLDDLDGRREFNAERAYYRSKLALLSHTLRLARTSDPAEIVANAVWVPAVKVDRSRVPSLPGWKRRIYEMKRHFAAEPEEIAPIYADLALDPRWGSHTGCVVDPRGRTVKPVRNVRDRFGQDRLEAATVAAMEDFASQTRRQH